MSQQQGPYIGGQAVIEGVMMRAPNGVGIACRKPDGTVVVEEGPVPKSLRSAIWKLPLFRGVGMLGESLGLGFYALRFSAEQQMSEEEKESASTSGMMWVSALLAIGLFIALPQLLAKGTGNLFGLTFNASDWRYQIAIGAFKLLIFTTYLLLLSRTKEAQRLFQYHGAEHKTINAYEAGKKLNVENVLAASRLHPRCGTTFLLVVVVFSVVAAATFAPVLVPASIDGTFWGQIALFALRIALLPLIAALSYEFQRFTARYCSTGPLRFLVWPGFLFQRITTRNPDAAQVEVAIVAFTTAKRRNEKEETNSEKQIHLITDFSSFAAEGTPS